jgi:hypothetical protein
MICYEVTHHAYHCIYLVHYDLAHALHTQQKIKGSTTRTIRQQLPSKKSSREINPWLARNGPQQPRKLVRDWLELARIGPHESNFAGDYLCIELLAPKKCTNNKQKLAGDGARKNLWNRPKTLWPCTPSTTAPRSPASLIPTAALNTADLDDWLMEWPHTLWSRRQVEHLDARDLLPLPKSSPNTDREASLPGAELTALPRGSHSHQWAKAPYGENFPTPSVRDRRPPPATEIAALRHQHWETLTREGIWDRDGEKRRRNGRRKRRGSAFSESTTEDDKHMWGMVRVSGVKRSASRWVSVARPAPDPREIRPSRVNPTAHERVLGMTSSIQVLFSNWDFLFTAGCAS